MSMIFTSAFEALTGIKSKQPLPQRLSDISEENVHIARSLIKLAKKLEDEGKIEEASQLKEDIRQLLQNNEKVLETAKLVLNYV